MTLPRTSPTKATIGVAIVSASHRSPLEVSDRRPAPTKATPPSAIAGKVYVFKTPHTQRPKNLVKFKAPHGKVLGVAEQLAVSQGRELTRRTLEAALQQEAAAVEKKGAQIGSARTAKRRGPIADAKSGR